MLRGLGCLAQIFPHLGSQARLAQVAAHAQRRYAAARAAPRTGAAPRRLPVAAHAGTGASVADATFLVGISSHRSIGAAADLGCTWRVRRAAARLARWPMRPSRPARM